jgi:hypothetical protein
MPAPTLSDATIRTMSRIDYDLIAIATDLATAAERLALCTDSRRAGKAAGRLRQLAYAVQAVLLSLDEEVHAAQVAAESLEEAPF